jgi:hypothetical protein
LVPSDKSPGYFLSPSGLNGVNDAGVHVGNETLSGQTHACRLTFISG